MYSKFKVGFFCFLSFLLIIHFTMDNTEQAPLQNNTIQIMALTPKNTCVNPPIKSEIEIDISEQQLHLFCHYTQGHKEVKTYPISSSKYGIGNQAGSNKTPLGLHRIEKKFGANAPLGLIFKARQSTGRIATINAENGATITTRIMWLKGLEAGKNSGRGIDSYKRYIYIHGTAEENKIGQPASHGCIRMYNRDVIHLFDRITTGTQVYIKK